MNTERPFPPPRFLGLLWVGWWLALAWLAGIAWHHEPAPVAKPMTPVATEKVMPLRPAFEDMQAFTADHRFISFEQWSTWLDQSQQAAPRGGLSAAALAHEPQGFTLRDVEVDRVDGLDMPHHARKEPATNGKALLQTSDAEELTRHGGVSVAACGAGAK